jgi:pyridoxamine 5'-phosphate oxidase family protein
MKACSSLCPRGLARRRLATVAADGQPDVVPVALEFDGSHFWIGGPGESFMRTRKVRNIEAGGRRVALVVDDMVSFEPINSWTDLPRSVDRSLPSR